MGCVQSSSASPEERKSKYIEQKLSARRDEDDTKIKLLLIGAGGVGKSTLFKQMRLLYGEPRTEGELHSFRMVIRANIITAITLLCNLIEQLNLEAQLASETVVRNDDDGEVESPKQAYDTILSRISEVNVRKSEIADVGGNSIGGNSAKASNDMFLEIWRSIKTLWKVRKKN